MIYDAVHARWLAIEESWDCISDANASFGHGYLDLAVSRTTDPTGTWDVYPFGFDDELPDMATIGVSTDKVGITANVYPFISQCTFGSFAASYIAAFDWSGLTAAHGSIVGYAVTDSTRFGVQVADQVPAVTTALQLLDQANDGSGDIEYFNADGTTAANTFAFGPGFDLASYGIAGPSLPLGGLLPQQPGPASITADIDNRLTGAVWQNNKLATVSTYPCHPTGDTADRLCVRVTELNTSIVDASTPPSLVQDFLLNAVGRTPTSAVRACRATGRSTSCSTNRRRRPAISPRATTSTGCRPMGSTRPVRPPSSRPAWTSTAARNGATTPASPRIRRCPMRSGRPTPMSMPATNGPPG